MLLHAVPKLEAIKGETASLKCYYLIYLQIFFCNAFHFVLEVSFQFFTFFQILAKSLAQLADDRTLL